MIEVACTCGKRVRVADELAGRRGRCSACGSIIRIPDAPGDGDGEGYAVTPKPDPPATDEGLGTGPVVSSTALPSLVEPEPWFYAHLWNYARVLKLSVSVVVWVGLIVLVLVTLGALTAGSSVLGVPEVITFWLVGLPVLIIYRFFALVRASLLFLRVDQARNIRRMRLRAERD